MTSLASCRAQNIHVLMQRTTVDAMRVLIESLLTPFFLPKSPSGRGYIRGREAGEDDEHEEVDGGTRKSGQHSCDMISIYDMNDGDRTHRAGGIVRLAQCHVRQGEAR